MPVIKKGKTEAIQRYIPHEPEEFINFLPVSWVDLEEAEKVQTERAIATSKGYPEHLVQAIFARHGGQQEDDEGERPKHKPASAYDRLTLLVASIDSWSFEESVNEDSIRALDEGTASWAVEQALEITRGLTDGGKGSASSS